MQSENSLENINHVSILETFWLRFQPHHINFGFDCIPAEVHFTLVFDERYSKINLHITKNTVSSINKPKITIFEIEKSEVEKGSTNSFLGLLQKVLIPLDIKQLKMKNGNKISFLSFNDIEDTEAEILIKQKLFESFRNNMIVKRKSRLKIKGDLEKGFSLFSTSEELHSKFKDKITCLPTKYLCSVEAGIIITGKSTFAVIRIDKDWYSINTELTLEDYIGVFMKTDDVKHLIWKVKRAIVSIQKAKTYSDVEHLDVPVQVIYTGQ